MDDFRNSERFAEIEKVLADYFGRHLAPVMRATEESLRSRQLEEMAGYSRSAAGILDTMATAQHAMPDPYRNIKMTGEWNSKTVEDCFEMCKEAIAGNDSLQKDLALIAGEWRSAVVAEIGRERYDELSSALGGDLAYAYAEYRIEQMMTDRLVKESMPQSSAEYIMQKAAQNSLLGLSSTLDRSPLAQEIEERCEAAYRPSKAEKAAGWALGSGIDAVTLGGIGSWGGFARFVGADLAVNAILSSGEKEEPLSVEDCISKGVFGSDTNVFEGFRERADRILVEQNDYILSTDGRLANRITGPAADISESMWADPSMYMYRNPSQGAAGEDDRYRDIPMAIAPGQEEAHLRDLGQEEEEKEGKKDTAAGHPMTGSPAGGMQAYGQTAGHNSQEVAAAQATEEGTAAQTNEKGWDSVLSSLGLGDFGAVGHNLGYVFAMLPDVLLGMFTGRTKSLDMKDNLIPVASIVAGVFIKNPVLKMLMIGFGGASLLNKAGHEVLDWHRNGESTSQAQGVSRYRVYQDEALNPRIASPILQGGSLIASIDGVPCTIQLPEKVIDAYNAGALPLNTLANAVLARYDQMQQMAARNYDNGDRETVARTRGIQ